MRTGALAVFLALTAATCSAALVQEDFSSDPASHGWQSSGVAELFRWNAEGGELEATWDSSRPNSYYYKPLPTVLSKLDDFEVTFRLRLDEVAFGITEGRPFTFEVAIGLTQLSSATQTNFVRGTGNASPNLVEFDYFPDSGFGATLSPTIVSSNNQFRPSFTFPLELTRGEWFNVAMRYQGSNQTLSTTLRHNGESAGQVKDVRLTAEFSDFRVDAFAISSYSDQGADGSVRARGRIDDVTVTTPDPPVAALAGNLSRGRFAVSLMSRIGWVYQLERTVDWATWRRVGAGAAGTDSVLLLEEDGPPVEGAAFYRVQLLRP